MEVRLEHTGGRAKAAQVWVNEELLTVCDGVSSSDKRCGPGLLENVTLGYMTEERFTWEQAAAGNRSRKKSLAHIRDWAYSGYGQVVSIMPVVIDYGNGILMEDGNWTNDESLIGKYVRVAIDRLEIAFAAVPD